MSNNNASFQTGGKYQGVVAISSDDVWAVGYKKALFTGAYQTLISHWNGHEWRRMSTPNAGSTDNKLYSLAWVSDTDIWAVGSYAPCGSCHLETLVLHWNGTNWSIVTSPNPGDLGNVLFGISAADKASAWAVGYSNSSTKGLDGLILRWNGSKWEQTPRASPGTLQGITAISKNDVWAVGSEDAWMVLQHWDGTSWQAVTAPALGTFSSSDQTHHTTLFGVDAKAANDVWAVGSYEHDGVSEPFALHWDGNRWSVSPGPNPGSPNLSRHSLAEVSLESASTVWASGYYGDGVTTEHSLVLRWNGSQWLTIPGPDIHRFTHLEAVAALPPGEIWTVGSAGETEFAARFIESACDAKSGKLAQ